MMTLTKNKIKKILKDNLYDVCKSCFKIKKRMVQKPKNKNKNVLLLKVQEMILKVFERFL
jgi:hypothetical protein